MPCLLVLSLPDADEAHALREHLAVDTTWLVRHEICSRVWVAGTYRQRPDVVALIGSADRADTPLEAIVAAFRRNDSAIPLLLVLPADASERDFGSISDVDDVLVAPLRPVEVRGRLGRLAERARSEAMADACARLAESAGLEMLVTQDAKMAALKLQLPLIARSDVTALIAGETGSGKEVVARSVHHLSPRADHPFLPVNCGAVPVELFENELFGHGRGAYTDARASSQGLIAQAEGGTLFLDEVDAIPLGAQVKLLRFLQDRTYRPLGSSAARRANVRLIAATNVDLEGRVRARTFREDLYYRLNVIPIAVPPLRERPHDVPILVRHFVDRHAAIEGRGRWRFTGETLAALSAYDWPGNVRQLENVVQQILALRAPGRIDVSALPLPIRTAYDMAGLPPFREAKAEAVASFERDYARRLMLTHGGNVTRAAEAAGKERRAFGRLVKKYGIEGDTRDERSA